VGGQRSGCRGDRLCSVEAGVSGKVISTSVSVNVPSSTAVSLFLECSVDAVFPIVVDLSSTAICCFAKQFPMANASRLCSNDTYSLTTTLTPKLCSLLETFLCALLGGTFVCKKRCRLEVIRLERCPSETQSLSKSNFWIDRAYLNV